MKKIKLVVCDDELIQRKFLAALLERFFSERNIPVEISYYGSGEEFLENKEQDLSLTDLFLLDIFMPNLSGIELAKEIKERNAPGKIIFITGGNDYVTEAFELKAFSYIQKPVVYEKLSKVLSNALESAEKVKYMDVMVDRETERVYLDDVEYVETMGRRLLIHLHEDDMETYMSMKAFMDQHGKDDFLQISRYIAVSKDCIQKIVGRNLTLQDGTELPISEKYLANARKTHTEYLHTKKVASV